MSGWYWLLILLFSSGLYLAIMIALGEDKHGIVMPLSISRDLADVFIEIPGIKKVAGLSVYVILVGPILLIEIIILCLLLSCLIFSRFDTQPSPPTASEPQPPP